ncbi:hypothetical protein [Candidatus Laterigemmans baculatus]|uniref:hypothetical protein n=1 Tax=Candidatus Laterigemmans baculatus TaxID=2770505 RepID=UPI0013DD28D0|nr:hypothetical protein [Candidatus Laterigemmans baculatus]
MTTPRPEVDGLLVAELIDSVPGRVRKRLDQNPDAASAWHWQQQQETWLIQCEEETVTLQTQDNRIVSRTEIACSCLLSPKCFHVLACISLLETASGEAEAETGRGETAQPDGMKKPDELSGAAEVAIAPELREAARAAQAAVAAMLVVGAARAGLLLQSALLRAGHSCRSSGLIQLSNTVLRIHEGVQRLRRQEDTADGVTYAQDLAAALQLSYEVLHASAVPQWMIGQPRRAFHPVAVRKLEGVCAEPILTLSGYAGVCVYLQEAQDGRPGAEPPPLYTINELRTGESQLVQQAYRGGIELGTLSLTASELCRRRLSVQGLTASSDGRLGKGRSTRWAALGMSEPLQPFRTGRFRQPLSEQIEQVFERAHAIEPQSAGWDLVAFEATVVGPDEAGLLVRVPQLDSTCRLRIANDDPELRYRDNLQLLARCPRLSMRCLARLRLDAAGEMDLLAVTPADPAEADDGPQPPTFNLPPSWDGLCNLGLDKLQRHHLQGIERWSDEVVWDRDPRQSVTVDDGLAALRRRLIGVALGGLDGIPPIGTAAHQRDLTRLQRRYQSTAAQLVDDLATAAAEHRQAKVARGVARERVSAPFHEVYLACHIYTREAALAHQRSRWTNLVV